MKNELNYIEQWVHSMDAHEGNATTKLIKIMVNKFKRRKYIL